MTTTRTGIGWGGRLLIGLVLILIGASATVYALGHYQPAARFLGIFPTAPPQAIGFKGGPAPSGQAEPAPATEPNEAPRVAALEQRLAAVEHATQRAEGSAGRADALVVAFAARRAIDRGIALGYLENLLTDRFGAQHQAAVATIVTSARQPVLLSQLNSEYGPLERDLKRGGPDDSWWTGLKQAFGSLVEVHRADRPAVNVDARYTRAAQHLSAGDVDQALTETMRLPGASRAGEWVAKARRYVAVHRALDEIESAALLPTPGTAPVPGR